MGGNAPFDGAYSTPSVSHSIDSSSWIILLAALTDYFIGDPWGWIHPVQVMGWIIKTISDLAIKFCAPGWQRRLAGLLLGVLLIGGSGFLGWAMVKYFTMLNHLLGMVMEIVLLASCFAGKSLRVAVEDVIEPLAADDIPKARTHLSRYVGRDTENLSPTEILRALLETVAENAVDGVTAPLFYGIVGIWVGLGAVPLALAYKAASTLDSMVGYLREPFTDLGWFSAQLEDRLTWIPCRLTVLTLSWLTFKPRRVWKICRRDGVKDPSPNSGWSEATYAAILGVQLGGTNTYQGVIREKPLLGDAVEPISLTKINQALSLTRYCCLIWLAIAVTLDAWL